MAASGLTAALLLGPTPARAQPSVDFACGKPVMGFGEDVHLSRYTLNVNERVFEVRVYLGGGSGPAGITVGPKQNGVCRLRLPVGNFLLQPVTWREANVSAADKPLYDDLKIEYAGGSRGRAEWLLLRQRDPKATGFTTIEFHVIYDQLEAAGN